MLTLALVTSSLIAGLQAFPPAPPPRDVRRYVTRRRRENQVHVS